MLNSKEKSIKVQEFISKKCLDRSPESLFIRKILFTEKNIKWEDYFDYLKELFPDFKE